MASAGGGFRLTSAVRIAVPAGDEGARNAADRLSDMLAAGRGVRPAIVEGEGAIRFMRVVGLPPEAYKLEAKRGGANISASDDAGLFYGAVTLWQLATAGRDPIAGIIIEDAPRFPWRGMMLDSARHFQSPAFVKQLIDWMAAHKLNRLHWHLVDDQGWRIEIPKYPRLTEVSAWRLPATAPGAPPLPRIGGFYTQAEIREIVAYAAQRHVTIVPEIEMPGHALAAIRAYPELGVGGPPPPGIESHWGVFPYLYNVDDSTFGFLEDVLRDVMTLFPSEYIHVGGDEAVKDQWKASPKIQARMRALGIKNEQALQSWFIARIQRFLSASGRKLIGWDEILDGGIAPGATVMSWRGLDGAVTAAKAGHDSVLSPSPILYLDHLQGSNPAEPPGRGGVMSLADIYAFDPAPAALGADEQRHILGLQGNLWTEHIRTEERAAAMAFPRMSAVAELGWSKAGARDFTGFVMRLVPQLERLRPMGLNASASGFAPEVRARPTGNGRATLTLSAQVPAEIRYTLDGAEPTVRSLLYREPVEMRLPGRLRAASFVEGRSLPGAIDRSFDEEAVRRRSDSELKLCTEAVALKLEDDAPAEGKRAAFLIDIMNPCWVYEGAVLDGIAELVLDVGQIPFNFQIGKDGEKISFRPPASPEGEMEVRLGCQGERIAVLGLAAAATNPAVTTLRAAIVPRTGTHDLCITYTARGPEPLWAVDAVGLVPAR
jgi:hexosaminidase